jgi:putative N-acetylmannosamine-6-phosphate epimerase
MLIDCDTCQVRGLACRDCVVTVLLGPPAGLGSDIVGSDIVGSDIVGSDIVGSDIVGSDIVELDEVEQAAVRVLAEGGLIPPLRLVPIVTHSASGDTDGSRKVG